MVRNWTQSGSRTCGIALLLVIGLSACSREEEIVTYEEDATEDIKTPLDSVAPMSGPMSGSMSGPMAAAASPLKYDAPEEWTKGEVGGMRKAAFVVERDGKKVEITVIDLAAKMSPLVPNINRWRGQVQLQPISEEEVEESTSKIEVDGLEGTFAELIGPEGEAGRPAILVVMVYRGSKAWFFKLFGDADLALEEKDRFQEFVKSVTFTAPENPHGHGAMMGGAMGGSMGGMMGQMKMQPLEPVAVKYEAPEGWESLEASGMRKAAFGIKDGEKSAEVTLIDLSAMSGGLLANVNRWRDQVGLPKTTQENLAPELTAFEVAGQAGQLVELVGPEDADRPLKIVGVILPMKDRTWYFKMIGDAEIVSRERERFEQFAQSVSFAADGDNDE